MGIAEVREQNLLPTLRWPASTSYTPTAGYESVGQRQIGRAGKRNRYWVWAARARCTREAIRSISSLQYNFIFLSLISCRKSSELR
jgi:hypothetical protein